MINHNILLKFHSKTDVNVTMRTESLLMNCLFWTSSLESAAWRNFAKMNPPHFSGTVKSNFPTLYLLLVKLHFLFLKQLSTITVANPEVKYNPIYKICNRITGIWSDCDYLNREWVCSICNQHFSNDQIWQSCLNKNTTHPLCKCWHIS